MRLTLRLLAFAGVLAFASSAMAQGKLTGKCSQGKPDPNYTIRVDDGSGRMLVLGQVTCKWSGGEIAGIAIKDEIDSTVSDMSGTTSRDRGYGIGAMANGDKYYVRFEGTTKFKGEAPTSSTCTWTFYGGTGKLKGLTGKGTCTGKFDASGGAVFDITGEYSIAASK
jgi:hypothetical protein